MRREDTRHESHLGSAASIFVSSLLYEQVCDVRLSNRFWICFIKSAEWYSIHHTPDIAALEFAQVPVLAVDWCTLSTFPPRCRIENRITCRPNRDQTVSRAC